MAQHYEVVCISSEEGLLKTFKLFQKIIECLTE